MQFLVALVALGRRLELPLHRRHDAASRRPTARGEDRRAGGDGHGGHGDDDADLARLGRAGHDQGWTWLNLGSLVPRGAGSAARAACWLAAAQRPRLGGGRRRCTRPRAEPATRSKRNSRHSIGPFHIGTRRDSFRRIAPGQLHVGAQHPGRPAGRMLRVGAFPVRRQAREEVARAATCCRRCGTRRAARPCRATSMRSPYGGLIISVPGRPSGSSGAGRSSASPPLNSIAPATPARCALRRAKSTMRNDTSLATIGTALAWMRALRVVLQALPGRAQRRRAERQQALEREAALQPGRDAAGDLRGLDGDGAGAAAGVVQRAAGLGRAAPAGGGEHRGGQRLLQRRVALVLAPAALEERLAGAVDVQRWRAPGRGAAAAAGRGGACRRSGARRCASRSWSQTASLTRSAAKFRLFSGRALRGGVDAQRVARRDPVRPVDRARQRVEVVLVAVRAFGDLDQHTLREPATRG